MSNQRSNTRLFKRMTAGAGTKCMSLSSSSPNLDSCIVLPAVNLFLDSVLRELPQDTENFLEEVKSLRTAWRSIVLFFARQ